jgi:hypothetical protein
LRIKYDSKEEMLAIFSNKFIPEVAIISPIVIEHIVENTGENINIKTDLGGSGFKVGYFLKTLKHYPVFFSFLGNDEYFNFIINSFDEKNIPLTWSVSPGKNPKKIRIIDENKTYFQKSSSLNSISPLFLEEFLLNIKNVIISLENWNKDIIELICYMVKNVYLNIRYNDFLEIKNSSVDYIFVDAFENNIDFNILNDINCKKIFTFTNKKIYFNKTIIFEIIDGIYFEEAMYAFESVFLSGLLRKFSEEYSLNLALKAFKETQVNGNFNSASYL